MADVDTTRRDFLSTAVRGAGLLSLGGMVGAVLGGGDGPHLLWQIDPDKCIHCGKCATNCVLSPSAVKCFHAHVLCGYCKLCTGYFEAQPNALTTAAENQLCPTGAIRRTWVEDQYYEYKIDLDMCIGCARCVKGCTMFGNGSLFLQIDHTLCVNCNQCSIARACPSQAIWRIPAAEAYRLKTRTRTG